MWQSTGTQRMNKKEAHVLCINFMGQNRHQIDACFLDPFFLFQDSMPNTTDYRGCRTTTAQTTRMTKRTSCHSTMPLHMHIVTWLTTVAQQQQQGNHASTTAQDHCQSLCPQPGYIDGRPLSIHLRTMKRRPLLMVARTIVNQVDKASLTIFQKLNL
jgi:hypothetical protein